MTPIMYYSKFSDFIAQAMELNQPLSFVTQETSTENGSHGVLSAAFDIGFVNLKTGEVHKFYRIFGSYQYFLAPSGREPVNPEKRNMLKERSESLRVAITRLCMDKGLVLYERYLSVPDKQVKMEGSLDMINYIKGLFHYEN